MAVYFDVLADPGSWAFALSLGNHSITVSEAGASGREGRVTAQAALAPIAPAMPLKCGPDILKGGHDARPVCPFHHAPGDTDV